MEGTNENGLNKLIPFALYVVRNGKVNYSGILETCLINKAITGHRNELVVLSKSLKKSNNLNPVMKPSEFKG